MRSILLLSAIGMMVLCTCGCGDSSDVGQVEGLVTIDGNPAPAGVQITFEPEGEATSSYAQTDAEGRYVMLLPGGDPGVAVGMCTIYVDSEIEDEDGSTVQTLRIPPEWGEGSTQKIDVKPGKQEKNLDITT